MRQTWASTYSLWDLKQSILLSELQILCVKSQEDYG